jgi:iron complex outermembrane receptor protein
MPWLLALVPAAVSAQRTDSLHVDSLPNVRRPAVLAPVTVSALGGSLPLARVPYAVSLRAPTAGSRGMLPTAVDDVLRGVPGLAVDDRANIALGERIAIRGFGARTQFGVRGVRVEVDGVPATMPDGQTALSHVDPATVVRTEIFRGAASALFGNAAGGAIRMWTEAPVPAASGGLEFGFGERGNLVTRVDAGAANGALQATLRASRFDYRGFRQRSDARTDRLGGRLGWGSSRDTLSLVVATADYDAANPGSLAGPQRNADPRSASPTSLSFRTGERGRHRQAGAVWQRSAGSWTATTTLFALSRDVWNPIPSRIIDLERGAGGLRSSVDARFGDPARPWWLAIGGELGIQRDARRAYENVGGTATATQLDQRERVDAQGVHARLLAPVASRVDLVAALRVDRVAFQVDDRLVTAGDPDDSGERTMGAVSPTLGLTRAWGATSVFANVATAFETPTTSELANQASGAGGMNRELRPQRLTSLEGGVRTRVGVAATLSVAGFVARLRDALIPFELPSSPGRQFYRNAAQATHRGLELESAGVLGSRTAWRLAATMIDARFAAGDTAGGDRAGHRVPGIARWSGDAAVQVRANGWLEVEAVARGRSAMPVSDTASAVSPGRVVADLRVVPATWYLGSLGIAAALAFENVLDSSYDASVVVNAARERYYEPGPPRNVTLTVRAYWKNSGQ